MPKIPDPEYFHEAVTGLIIRSSAAPPMPPTRAGAPPLALLTLHMGGNVNAYEPAQVVLSGAVILRFGLQTAMPPLRYVIPGLFVGERGGALTGLKGWNYLQERWTHHPRADVVGIDATGQVATYFLKELDFGAPVHIFAYPDTTTRSALGMITAVITDSPTDPALPELLATYRPKIGP